MTDVSATPAPSADTPDDPYLWLEEVEGTDALAWVAERNAEATEVLATSERFLRIEAEIREVLDSADKIPGVGLAGDHLYNLWKDAEHERGLWRRTTLEDYRTDDPTWDVLLDLDELSAADGVDWVFHGAQILRTGPLAYRRALVDLSRGGSDADETREFDLVTRTFVAPEVGGFHRPEAKGGMSWVDGDTVFVATADDAATTSGYPRRARLLRRGQELADATVVFEGEDTDLAVSAHHDRTEGFERDWVSRALTFWTDELFLLPDDGPEKIDVPDSAEAGAYREWLLVEPREDWTVTAGLPAGEESRTYPAGSLLAGDLDAYRAGSRDLAVLFAPTPTTALVGATWTRHHLVVNVLDDVKNRLEVLTPPATGAEGIVDGGAGGAARGRRVGPGEWQRRPFPAAPPLGTVSVASLDRAGDSLGGELADGLWMTSSDYLTPTTLSLVTLAADGADAGSVVASEPLKAGPEFFESAGLVSEQHFAVSADGTRVPYFVVRPEDLATDGGAPTLLYAYGGFEISLTPGYSGGLGRAWLNRGGVYVVANIRGGGEYGPTWHQAALKQNRPRAYEDLAAVAADLVARGITSPEHLGVQGGSNGGLLAGNMLATYPELFGAVVIQVPLLDMRRYHLLLAGASWMAEYGNPEDPAEWEFIQRFSPYHLVRRDRTYPPVLLTTSTRDDRVHPGHARKFAALLRELGHEVLSYENVEGGHGGASTNAQAAMMGALAYEFLWSRLA
ncbi:MAG: S9 family peptidase [Salana multivorans]|nr:S9 family peptidase [Salana multivorans]